MISSALAIIFVAYILQCVFSWLQLKRIYGKVDEVRRLHKGEACHLVTGSGRQKFLVMKKGVFMILIVNFNGRIADYYSMEGYTVFSTPKRNVHYIGLTLDEMEEQLTKKNQILALRSAREQLGYLCEANAPASAL